MESARSLNRMVPSKVCEGNDSPALGHQALAVELRELSRRGHEIPRDADLRAHPNREIFETSLGLQELGLETGNRRLPLIEDRNLEAQRRAGDPLAVGLALGLDANLDARGKPAGRLGETERLGDLVHAFSGGRHVEAVLVHRG